MVPIKYQVVGEEDYAFVVEIGSTGKYVVQSGTYTSQPPRSGQLTRLQEDELLEAISRRSAFRVSTPCPRGQWPSTPD